MLPVLKVYANNKKGIHFLTLDIERTLMSSTYFSFQVLLFNSVKFFFLRNLVYSELFLLDDIDWNCINEILSGPTFFRNCKKKPSNL